jgi:hypothetical protein
MSDFDPHSHFSLAPNIQFVGQGQPVIAQASAYDVDLQVYPACDQACNIADAFYLGGPSSFSSTVAWTAASGVEYLILVSSTEFASGSNEFEVRILVSHQQEALDWMTNADSTDLQSTLSEDELVERFVLLVLYFATAGENWNSQDGFLNPLNTHCSWNRNIGNGFVQGVVCNDEGSVVTLDLSKFLHLSTC